MKLGDGLFLNTFRRVAEEYKGTGLEYNDMIVDNTYVSRTITVADSSNAIPVDQCSLSRARASSTSWSCPTCTAPSSLTLVLLSSVDRVSSQGATLDAYVTSIEGRETLAKMVF